MIDGQQQVRQLGRGDHENLTVSATSIIGNFGDEDHATPAVGDSATQASSGLGKA